MSPSRMNMKTIARADSQDCSSSDDDGTRPQWISARSSPAPSPLAASSSEHEAGGTGATSLESSSGGWTLPSHLKRSAQFWFRDGSVVLQVEETLFRVHQSILANHSEVFAGLFELPQPEGEDGEGMLEGCPIVTLHDSEKDFEELLRVVYLPSYFDALPMSAPLDTTLDFISGPLRLSTKYLLKSIRARCVAYLTAKFPTTFEDYVAKSTPAASPPAYPHPHPYASSTHHPLSSYPSMLSLRSSSPSNAQGATTERYKSESVIRAILLAHASDVATILPYAYYCLARTSLKRFMKEPSPPSTSPSSAPSPSSDLGWQLKCQILVGRERLRQAEMSLSHSFLLVFQRAPTCNSTACALTRGPHAEFHLILANKAPNPLRLFTHWDKMGVCGECEEWSRGVHERGRREVWEKLPGMFGLEGWEALKRGQEASMVD